jgi:hypothetical protein
VDVVAIVLVSVAILELAALLASPP